MKAKVKATGRCSISDDGKLSSDINLEIKKENKDIDWEQRRYEIAKDVYVSLFSHYRDLRSEEIMAADSIAFADALIKELKRKEK